MLPKPNMPTAIDTKSSPSNRSGAPKVKRCRPVWMSVPTSPSMSPMITMASALATEPRAITTAATSPSTIREKYSAAPNVMASAVSGTTSTAMTKVATEPANSEPSAATASAEPARPCRAIWCPSRQVTTDELSPGRFTRIAVVEPPYCAP